MSRVRDINKHLKAYDSELFATQEPYKLGAPEPAIWVCRRNRTRPHEPHYVFALTDTWTPKGRPVEWGIEPIINRLKAIDIWKNEKLVDEILGKNEEAEASDRRHLKNNVESFLREFRKPFAKATNDINTSLLPKTDKRRQGEIHGR